MFTWICPHCGAEVPPSESECPNCAARQRREAESQPGVALGPPALPVDQTVREEAVRPVTRRGMPGWLTAILVAAVAIGAGTLAVRYWTNQRSRAAGYNSLQAPPQTAQTGSARLARYIEVTGFRIIEDENRRLQIQFLVVNHSPADIMDLAGTVRLRSTVSKPSDPPIGTFEFRTTRLAPYASIEFKTTLNSRLRAYEIPDWQYLRAEVEITSPKEL